MSLMLMLCLIGIFSAAVVLSARVLSRYRRKDKPATTDPPPRREAGAQVSGTFELLEGILLRLRMSDILAAQTVSKQSNQVIGNSLPLQRAIFLAPASNLEDAKTAPQGTLNLLFFSRFGSVFGDVSISRQSYIRIWKAKNGLYKHDEEFVRLCTGDPVRLRLKHEGGLTVELPKESWSGMYLTQPPCQVEFGVEEQEGRPAVTVLEGPTMGEVIIESRRRLAGHVKPEDLPRIVLREAALFVWKNKCAKSESN
ncbi:hypothetical protein LTR36_003893 [Oleoguttula mirabilis]|uniref:F-box domain-containing protein n=1 Tax=Oleoguttula mirabilis TaxID=1507867 RepID=A0AAV9JJ71_9PEZI|nr:hypothetical protein LTR36_003893 [Oleoguttula mirabilis]